MPAEPLLAGRYAHLEELGRGASGRVLLVEDRVGGGTRAVKIVSAEDGERLRWELTLLASLAHPGLARVYELFTLREPLGPSTAEGSAMLSPSAARRTRRTAPPTGGVLAATPPSRVLGLFSP